MLQKRLGTRLILLAGVILATAVIFPLLSIANDPPHNEASGISCSDCHGETLLSSQSPFYTDNCSDTAYNSICLSVCHNNETVGYDTGNVYDSTTAPMIQSHTPGGTVIKCITCHHNHDQDQIYAGKNEKDKFFLAMGTLAVDATTPISYDSGTNRTTLLYEDLSPTDGLSKWTDLNYLAKKTGDGRGAMLVPDYKSRKRWPIYIIKDIDGDAKTITVKGNVSSASNLGIFYGQLIRRAINYEPDPDNPFAFMPASVKYYDGSDSDGFINNSATGMCQICHVSPDVTHWTNDGNGDDHNPDTNCMVCHGHSGGFLHGGGGTDCFTCHDSDVDHDHRPISAGCESCHTEGTQLSVDTLHTDCSRCHGYTGSKLNKSQVVQVINNGRGTEGLDQSCEECHGGGHDSADAHNNRLLIGMLPECADCHAIGDHDAVDALHGNCSTCHDYQGALSASLINAVISTGMGGTDRDCQDCHTVDHAAYDTDSAHDRRDRATGSFRFDCSSAGCHIVTDQASLDTLHTKCDTCHFYTGTKLDRTLIDQVITDGKGVGGTDPNCESCHTWEPHHDMAQLNRSSCESCHLGNVVVEHVDQRTYDCDTCHASGVQAVIDTIADGKNDTLVTCDSCHNDDTVNPAGTYQAVHHASVHSQNGDCLYCHGVGRGVNGQRQASCSKCHAQGEQLDPQRPSTNAHAQGPAITNVQDYRACFSCHLKGNRGYDFDPDGLPIGDPDYSGTPVVFPYHAKPSTFNQNGRGRYGNSNEDQARSAPGLGIYNLFVNNRVGSKPDTPAFPMYWAPVKYSGEVFDVPSHDGTGLGGQYAGAGNLTVTIEPPDAIAKRAQWSVDGLNWLASGTVLSGLSSRQYLVEPKKVLDWASPSVKAIDITDGSSENITLTYVPCPPDPSITISGTVSDGATITWDSATQTEMFQVQAGDFRNGDIHWVLTTGGGEGFTLVQTGPESVSLEKNGWTVAASYSFTLQATGSNCPGNEATISFTVDVTPGGIFPPNAPSTGIINDQVIDSYTYKLDLGQVDGPDFDSRPKIFHIGDNIYGLLHREELDHYPGDTYLQTFEILPSGKIQHIENYRFGYSAATYAPTAVRVSGSVFAIAYTYYDGPRIETVSINNTGSIESIKKQSFSYGGDNHPFYQSQLQELGNGYFVFTNDKFMFTVHIDPTGKMITEVDSREPTSAFCNLKNEGVVHIANDIYVYCDGTTLNTINISATGDISDDPPIDTIDTLERRIGWLYHLGGNTYLAAGGGFLGSYEIQDNGRITAKHLGGFRLGSTIGNLLHVDPDVFAVALKDGSLKTFQVTPEGMISLGPIDMQFDLGGEGVPDLLPITGDDPIQNNQVYAFASIGEINDHNAGLKTICIYDPETEDQDNDGFCDQADTCPDDPGVDADGDGLCGDADPCPQDASNDTLDNDTLCGGEGFNGIMTGEFDNCPTVANGLAEKDIPNVGNQLDTDEDGVGDACDNCMGQANTDQVDIDCDGIGDACDADIGTATVGSQCYFSTIQAAIDASTDGGTILVKDGIYIENILISNKGITLRSENGHEFTTIDGSSRNTSVVSIRSHALNQTVLDGFTIENGNSVGRPGGGVFISGASPTITNCIIRNNTSDSNGGGIYAASDYTGNDPVIISNTVIDSNTADSSHGGGVYSYKVDLDIINSRISNNSAVNGGGIWIGLGVNIYYQAELMHLVNCTIADNTASDGGGIYITNLSGWDLDTYIANSILWGNTADSGGNQIVTNDSVTVLFSDIEGGWSGSGSNNLDADPKFVGGGDYHLTDNSPCIDSGTDDLSPWPLWPEWPPLPVDDIEGDLRSTCPTYDMGADELLDPDGDGICNSDDICLLGDDAADADGDGVPDACDLCPGFDDIANDSDGDGLNDACDLCPGDNPDDIDGDGVCAGSEFKEPMTGGNDPCPIDNPDDSDLDGVCDSVDICPGHPDDDPDGDGDGIPNVCDPCPSDNPDDSDSDGICTNTGFNPPSTGDDDNCPDTSNTNQSDCDNDGIGDACDPVGTACTPATTDSDGDGVYDDTDNCLMTINPDQTDSNTPPDGMGDACTLYHFIQKELSNMGSWGFAKEAKPQLSGSRLVVWHDRSSYGEDFEIYLYDDSTGQTTQLTDNSVDDMWPQVNYDGDVVWQGHDGTRNQIYLYDHQTTNITRISETAIGGEFPKINSGYNDVVWVGHDGTDDDIYLYDRSISSIIQVTDNNTDDFQPQINGWSDVAWTNFDGTSQDIYYYRFVGGTTTELSVGDDNEWQPRLNGRRDVVYLRYDQIVYYDSSEDQNSYLTNYADGGSKSDHDINYNNNLIWSSYDNGVHFYDTVAGEETIISSNGRYPRLNDNDDVVWTDDVLNRAYYYNSGLDRTFQFYSGWAVEPDLNIRGDVTWRSGKKVYLSLFGIDPDTDADGISDTLDNCIATENSFQIDSDLDGIGDACDNCPSDDSSTDQTDCDGDGLGDICDGDSSCSTDTDGDTVFDDVDNCMDDVNPGQEDCDDDGTGDVCEADVDTDGLPDDCDNCPAVDNPDQADCDIDGVGDVCETDSDADSVPDDCDNCINDNNPGQLNADLDALGNACDPDDDNDGVPDGTDNCQFVANPGQEDFDDGDGIGDACDACPTGPVCASFIPSTGQVTCYGVDGTKSVPPGSPSGQDCEYQTTPPSFTEPEPWNGIVTDDNTGLEWQKDDSGAEMNLAAATTYCADFVRDGYDDWRLPTKKELFTLLDYEFETSPALPAIDLNHFPPTQSVVYLTNSNWSIDFGTGWVDGWGGVDGYVRCVRGEALTYGPYIDEGDGTVTDVAAGLVWQKNKGPQVDWETALQSCVVLGPEWRLPSVREMQSIVDETTNQLDPAFGVHVNTMYWTATTGLFGSDLPWAPPETLPRGNYAEIVDLGDGSIRSGMGSVKTDPWFSYRCVKTSP